MCATMKLESRPRALVYVLSCVVCWALIPELAIGTPEQFGHHNVLLWSNVISALVLTTAAALRSSRHQLQLFNPTAIVYFALLAFLGVFGYYGLLFSAYADHADKAGILIAVQYTWPALTAGLLAHVAREKSGMTAWVGVFLAMAGVALAVWGSGRSSASDLVVLQVALAACMFAAYSTISRRSAYEPYSSLAVVFTLAAIMSFVWVAASGTYRPLRAEYVPLILVNGIFVNGISYVWWYRALHYAPATFLAPWVSITPALGTLIVFARGAPVEPVQVVGIGLVASSVLLASLSSHAGSRAAHLVHRHRAHA
jgi:drug/metabolite transporter (DMT)-like permease